MENNRKVLLIGGSGNLGRRLYNQLQKNNFDVAIGGRNLEKVRYLFGNCRAYEVDLEDPKTINKAIKEFDPEIVVNASYISYAPNIIKAAGTNVKQFIFVGSTGVFTKLPSRSADQKRRAEEFLTDTAVNFTVIRPTMIYGHEDDNNMSKLLRVMRKTPVLPLIGKGENLVQPIYIEDLVYCLLNLIGKEGHQGRFYCVGGPEPLTNSEVFKTVRDVYHQRCRFVSLDPGLIRYAVKILTWLHITPVSEEQVGRFQEDKSLSKNDFNKLTGKKPLEFKEGLKRANYFSLLSSSSKAGPFRVRSFVK